MTDTDTDPTPAPTAADARRARTDDKAAAVVALIVDALETGAADPAAWRAPWNTSPQWLAPINATTRKPYTGGNRWVLALVAEQRGYAVNQWATFNQWTAPAVGGRLVDAKGQGVPILRPRMAKITDAATGEQAERIVGWQAHYVFNVAHVQGAKVDGPAPALPTADPTEWDDATDDYLAAVARVVDVRHDAQPRAYYSPTLDYVHLPNRDMFTSADGYYSTAAHEYGHATGHESRLARTFGRFGDDAYAAEELCAELTAALVMAQLGRSSEPRADHAQYLGHWLRVLKAEPSALFTVAGKAERAASWLADAAARHLADVRRARETWGPSEPEPVLALA